MFYTNTRSPVNRFHVPAKVLHLDVIEPGHSYGAARTPLRAELEIQAFGVSAYRGEVGDLLVPKHNEGAGGGAGVHEELYVVISGRATFSIEEERFDAPQGTRVFVVRRATEGEDFGDRARERAAREPLLDPIRNDPSFPSWLRVTARGEHRACRCGAR